MPRRAALKVSVVIEPVVSMAVVYLLAVLPFLFRCRTCGLVKARKKVPPVQRGLLNKQQLYSKKRQFP